MPTIRCIFLSSLLISLTALVLIAVIVAPKACYTNEIVISHNHRASDTRPNVSIRFADMEVWNGPAPSLLREKVRMNTDEGSVSVVVDGKEMLRGGYVYPYDGTEYFFGIGQNYVHMTTFDHSLFRSLRSHLSCLLTRD